MKQKEYTEIVCRGFCRFYKEGKEELQCGTYLFLREKLLPADLISAITDIQESPDFSMDGYIREHICNRCDFLVDGCGYRDDEDSPPCGGYVIVEYLVKKAMPG
ncbi:hypothetical protein BMS3Abin07_02358 [bacterium BMS3Abin07]|nr:hypothetical protein BMS3Abin07_02358 [bacterium BMS3Abin07]GBE31383.1 hypothetical protein BMS3Bbin05_00283 [bacterium BMS3Bbin05]HDL19696.1 hypothetical protein [Nitrospirota bacterium]HDO21354.1 hypothetical protein [Nitrospirota bacterium]HDZ87368.1 hypothetical protein [Nitrospirota bacterium]